MHIGRRIDSGTEPCYLVMGSGFQAMIGSHYADHDATMDLGPNALDIKYSSLCRFNQE
jgi:hypothetical protein